MKSYKFLSIVSLIIPLFFSILFVFNLIFWGKNIFLYFLYGSLILSSILISISLFLAERNVFIALINLIPASFSMFFSIWQFILENNHTLFHKYYDLMVGGIFSLTAQIILILCSSIYLIFISKDSSNNKEFINKEIRIFGIIGLLVFIISIMLVIPAYFVKLLLLWVIVWFIVQVLLLGYLLFILVSKKLKTLYIPVGINIIQYVISLMLMIASELTNFRYPLLSISYVIIGLISISSMLVNLTILTEIKMSKS